MSLFSAWSLLGGILIVIELLTGTFMFLILGVAALLVALLKFAGLENLLIEIGIFSGVSILGFLLLRRRLSRNPKGGASFAIDDNQTLIASADIEPRQEGYLDYQGAPWKVFNEGETKISIGDSVLVLRTEGTKLIIKKNNT